MRAAMSWEFPGYWAPCWAPYICWADHTARWTKTFREKSASSCLGVSPSYKPRLDPWAWRILGGDRKGSSFSLNSWEPEFQSPQILPTLGQMQGRWKESWNTKCPSAPPQLPVCPEPLNPTDFPCSLLFPMFVFREVEGGVLVTMRHTHGISVIKPEPKMDFNERGIQIKLWLSAIGRTLFLNVCPSSQPWMYLPGGCTELTLESSISLSLHLCELKTYFTGVDGRVFFLELP